MQGPRGIVSSLRGQLKHREKAVVGNKGPRDSLRSQGPTSTIDEPKVKWEERFDGKWVLQTDLEKPAAEEMTLQYRQLWMVAETLRTASVVRCRLNPQS